MAFLRLPQMALEGQNLGLDIRLAFELTLPGEAGAVRPSSGDGTHLTRPSLTAPAAAGQG